MIEPILTKYIHERGAHTLDFYVRHGGYRALEKALAMTPDQIIETVKTGTSKGNRDNWVVGVSSAFTLAVWVGNFDGSPMLRSSGATGAGPLFHQVMQALLRREPSGGRALSRAASSAPSRALSSASPRASDDEPVWVCAASGLLAAPACPHPFPAVPL